ncbi:MAG: hypothetical protein F4Y05_06600 [Acidimicrobiaceae bacterium]|nr:hypothetical protein [Acidimicrobiaceae bacterium]MXZ53757.1 hypothetical protein [Acidimicrobiaceae bacterium]MYE09256.1 hypothetical protein [Acidimicrobiaceae bacterium]MYH92341.1 hypothetical protein [Acidimicrobiaceae bacterium]
MCQSPFPYHGPLRAEQVSGRESLALDLAQRISDRRLTALIGPRRYGKTSLLKRVAADLEAVGPHCVWIDLYQLTSMSDLAAAVDSGLAGLVGPARRMLDAVAASVSLSIGVLELGRNPRNRVDPAQAVRNRLEVVVEAAARQNLFVVFDEFSGIADVGGGAGLLRTGLQHHFQSLGIVFAGSEPSTMRTLFSDQSQPFFAQADLVEIGPLDDEAVLGIIERGFAGTGRDAGTVARRIVSMVRGHPQRAMQLSDAVWRRVESGATAGPIDWEEALAEVRASVDAASERMFDLLTAGQRKVLRALAGSGSIYGREAERLDLPAATARDAAESLVGKGFLTRGERLEVVDPLLADWLRRRFLR